MSATTPAPAALWTPEQAAEFLATTPDYLKKLRHLEQGPPWFKLGRSVRYHPAQVARWLRGQQRGITPARTIGREARP